MKNQDGMILVQVLVFSLLIGIISYTIFESVSLSMHHDANYYQQINRIQATDSSLVIAEIKLAQLKNHYQTQASCNKSDCVHKIAERQFSDKKFWPTVASNLDKAEQPNYYMIELLNSEIDPKTHFITDYFQITAISWQSQQHSLRIAQRVVSKVFDDQGKAINQTVQRHSWRLVR